MILFFHISINLLIDIYEINNELINKIIEKSSTRCMIHPFLCIYIFKMQIDIKSIGGGHFVDVKNET